MTLPAVEGISSNILKNRKKEKYNSILTIGNKEKNAERKENYSRNHKKSKIIDTNDI